MEVPAEQNANKILATFLEENVSSLPIDQLVRS